MSSLHSGVRYTLRGSSDVERRIQSILARVAGIVAKNIPDHDYRALLLLGGYGRGEGGVVRERGEERPHNNLDFLLVTTPRAALRRTSLKKQFDEMLAPIVREERLGIDTGVISDVELRHAPARVIWFDLRWGHRTMLGDAAFIPSLRPVSARGIEIDDVQNLLVNRASLLVINDAVLERGAPTGHAAEYIVKHVMKSIIGHGDAILFTRGRYHASYLEKQRRMRELRGELPDLAALYEEAAEFRFEPNYRAYLGKDLVPYALHVREVLMNAHLAFERHRTKDAECTFRGHARRNLFVHETSMRSFVGSGKRLVRSLVDHPQRLGLSWPFEWSVRKAHPRRLLAAALPAVLYGPADEEEGRLAARILDASNPSPSALRRAYLAQWAKHGDPNFHTTAKQLGLSFDTTG